MRLVGGYTCRNCAEEAMAKRGLDPRKSETAARAEANGVPNPASPDFRELLDKKLALQQPEHSAQSRATLNAGSRLNLYA